MKPYKEDLKTPARVLRKNPTEAEQRLWSRLRGKQVHGAQFYRQKPIGDFIVDFYCAAANLVIEVDGGQHFDEKQSAHDTHRSERLRAMGLEIIRFDNRQVLTETEAVLEEIFRVVSPRLKNR